MCDKYINIGEYGSGTRIVGIYNHYINVYKYTPLKAELILNYQMILKIVKKD